MKKLIAGVLILCYLMTAIPAFAEVFIRIDRDDPKAWKNDLANVRFLTEERMSGSAQFSTEQFHKLAGQLKEQSQEVWIIDCRLESHGMVNGIAVSWCGEDNGANLGRTTEEIEAEEEGLSALIGTTYRLQTAWRATPGFTFIARPDQAEPGHL